MGFLLDPPTDRVSGIEQRLTALEQWTRTCTDQLNAAMNDSTADGRTMEQRLKAAEKRLDQIWETLGDLEQRIIMLEGG